ncbi:hypothetical protein PIIN_08711 [Serendipita indica DSM 11827]|uniref:F-box domain-containing protein n=1 Tax=Serendipita indica (strain DSM 11827) TaxID=1109443 RepID=G4TTW0_SERID|nr:hypothetical protein PIIN_08711 [Serendipita indica DSM 11827]
MCADSDPVTRFPPEISSKVLAFAASRLISAKSLDPSILVISSDYLLELTHVSTSWRDLILYSPELWADIVIDEDAYDMRTRVYVHCSLSKSHPVSLSILIHPSGNLALALHLLREHTSRIQSLFVFEQPFLPLISTALGPLPHLRTLLFPPRHKLEACAISFIEQNPQIQYIYGVTLKHDLLNSKWLHCLFEVASEIPLRELVPHLGSLKNLHTIKFGFFLPNQLTAYGLDFVPTIPWIHVRTWDFHAFLGTFNRVRDADILIPAVSKTLTTLETTLHVSLLPALLGQLAHCYRIRHVDMNLIPHLDRIDANVRIPPSATTHLTIRAPMATRGSEKWLPSTIKLLRTCFVNVLELKLIGKSAGGLLNLLSYGNLPKLTRVTLDKTIDRYIQAFSLSRSIQHLHIFARGANIYQYRSNTLSTLEIDHYESRENTPLDLNSWPALKTLQLSSKHGARWSGAAFKDLTTIDLHHRPTETVEYDGTNLLYHLGINPYALPALRELNLMPYIEWDILFITLEQRNIHTNSVASPLETLSFFSTIPAGFANKISKLLAGEQVDRPSNLHLSWVGNLNIIQDTDL